MGITERISAMGCIDRLESDYELLMRSCLEAQCLDLSIEIIVRKKETYSCRYDSAKTLSGVLCALLSFSD